MPRIRCSTEGGDVAAEVEAQEYLAELVARLRSLAGDGLRGVYAIGSLALGDYRPGASDIDVAVFTAATPPLATRRRIAAALSRDALPCPARGLEFVLYAERDAPAYAINLNTGARMEPHLSFDPDADPRFWFVLDLAIARSCARTLWGAQPAQVIPAMPEPAIREALREALTWYARVPGGGSETVLAACRAWRWTAERVWSSKGAAGRWAAARRDAPPVVAEALRARSEGGAVDPAAAAGFVAQVRAAL